MNKVKVSIVISSYNHEKFIKKSIDCVLNQTFQDFEIIIFDDCSTDKTFEITQSYKENPKIRIYKSPYNRGMVQNVNNAIQIAGGEYIANLNSDDYWEATKLEKQVDFLSKNLDHGAVFSDVNIVDEDDKIISDKNYSYFRVVNEKNRYEFLRRFFFEGNCLCYPSAMIRRSCFDAVGLYNPAFIVSLDFDMWTRICLAGYEIAVIKEKLTNFRLLKANGNLGRSKNASTRSLLELEIYLDNYFNIKSKDDFAKIFTDYDEVKLQNNQIKHCLLDLIFSEFLRLRELRTTNKIYWKSFKNMARIRSAAMHTFYRELSNNQKNIDIFYNNFGFDFKKYLMITTVPGFDKKSYKIAKIQNFFSNLIK